MWKERTMKILSWMMAVVLVAGMASFAMAEDGDAPDKPQPKGEKAEGKEKADKEKSDEKKAEEDKADGALTAIVRRVTKDAKDVTGKVEITKEDFDLIAEHWPELTRTFRVQPMGSSIKDAHKQLMENEEFLAWAEERDLNADDFTRKGLRLSTLHLKLEVLPRARQQLQQQSEVIERMRGMMEEEDFKAAQESIKTVERDIKAAEKLAGEVPGPTDAEKKLLEDDENKQVMRRLFRM
jgi:hypothetical protein